MTRRMWTAIAKQEGTCHADVFRAEIVRLKFTFPGDDEFRRLMLLKNK